MSREQVKEGKRGDCFGLLSGYNSRQIGRAGSRVHLEEGLLLGAEGRREGEPRGTARSAVCPTLPRALVSHMIRIRRNIT